MLISYQSKLLSKAAATLHFCSVVVVFFVQCFGNGRAAESVHDSRKSLQCQIVARAVFPEIILAEEDLSVSEDVPVALGGISDVTVEKVVNDDGQLVVRLYPSPSPGYKATIPADFSTSTVLVSQLVKAAIINNNSNFFIL